MSLWSKVEDGYFFKKFLPVKMDECLRPQAKKGLYIKLGGVNMIMPQTQSNFISIMNFAKELYSQDIEKLEKTSRNLIIGNL